MEKKKGPIPGGGGSGKRPSPPRGISSSIGPGGGKPQPPAPKQPARPVQPAPPPAKPPIQKAPQPTRPAPPPARPPIQKAPRPVQPIPPTAKPPAQKVPRPGQPVVQQIPLPSAPGAPKKVPAPVPSTAKKISSAERIQFKQQRQQQRYSYIVPAGAGAAAATGIAAGEVAQQQLDVLSNRLASLQQAAALVDVYTDLDETESTLSFLPGEIANLRMQGYYYANYLEHKAEVLAQQWASVREQVTAAINQRSQALLGSVNEAQRALQMAYSSGGAAIARAQSTIQQLESQVTAAQRAIDAMYQTIDDNVTQLMQQIEKIQWVLDQAREASFAFYEGEDFVSACRARYFERPEEGMEGILHLTSERLIFERKEQVASKKFLFITTEKQTIHEFIFDELIGHVEEVKASQKGFLGGQEVLEVLFAPDADIASAYFVLLNATNEEWVTLINKVRSGEIDRERVRAEGEAAVSEAPTVQVSEIPTKCPNCGAGLTTPVVRGMREVTCAYCGMIIRL